MQEYSEQELASARLQTDAKISLLQRRAAYYGNESNNTDISYGVIFEQILKSNRNQRRPDSAKRLGETQKQMTVSDLFKETEKRELDRLKKAQEELAIQREMFKLRAKAKELILLKIRQVEEWLNTVPYTQENAANLDSLESYLTELISRLEACTSLLYESEIDGIDKSLYLQRLSRLNIAPLESWMYSLKYNILDGTDTIQRIRELIGQFSEWTGIPLQLECNMHTEDDESYCQQLLADELMESQRQWNREYFSP
jgi:hypothetical protein